MMVATQSLKSGSVSSLNRALTVLKSVGNGHISETFLSILHFIKQGEQSRD